MKKPNLLASQLLTMLFLLVAPNFLHASEKNLVETDIKSKVESINEGENLIYSFSELGDQEITANKKYLLPVEADYEKRMKYVERNVPVRMQLHGHDLVWHYFIQSISVSYPINDDSLHLLEIL